MSKKDNIKKFTDNIYSKQPQKNYPTNKTVYNHINEIRYFDLADFSDCKTSKNEGFTYIFVIIHNFPKYLWAKPLKNKNSQIITEELSKILTKSKQKPLKIESDRGEEWYNSVFQNFLKVENVQNYSRFTDTGPSIAERVIRTIRNLFKKPVFEKGNADCLSELQSVVKHYNNTIHSSVKVTPFQAP